MNAEAKTLRNEGISQGYKAITWWKWDLGQASLAAEFTVLILL